MNERERQIASLEKKLYTASMAKKFIESEEGSYVIQYIQELVSQKTNDLINNRKTQEEYIEIRAQIDILRRLKQVLEVQANEQIIAKLNSDLELASSGE